uniref:Carbamoyl phosphate synthase small chain n=1 Tax=Calliarthron tuberculosum TaxID=48942 RepID=M4ITJ5_CALTB|nr:carbamoyl phosphate synthase small subunit [Calliarthron tuberculosum]AGA63760.1 carbamoyl phosphate synthase small subunit [Calliarthron tuberculosum]
MLTKTYSTFLQLEDGTLCQGWSFANSLMSIGEVVFNTGMTGYQEVLTDPSYCDQIILFTYPEIGNTGMNSEDMEASKSYAKGLIVKNFCLNPSSWRTKKPIIQYLIDQKIPHIFGIDTRYLTKYLRNKGVMVGCIVTNQLNSVQLSKAVDKFKCSQNFHLTNKVTTSKAYQYLSKALSKIHYISVKNKNFASLHVVVVDFGVKMNIIRRLDAYGCNITVVPASSSYNLIMSKSPDGILLSNGPGDPAAISFVQQTIQKLINTNIPIFGICLGHQLLGLSIGCQTMKLKFGHRGLNHPSGLHDQVRMTSQNHGFVVSSSTLPKDQVNITYINLNDGTIAGMVHKYKPCFSVQYHPEASPGPNDSDYLFSHFIDVMLACKS